MLHVPQTVTAERLVRGNVGKTVVAPFPYKKKYKLLRTFSDHYLPIRRVNYSRFLVIVLDYYMHPLHVLVIFFYSIKVAWVFLLIFQNPYFFFFPTIVQ